VMRSLKKLRGAVSGRYQGHAADRLVAIREEL